MTRLEKFIEVINNTKGYNLRVKKHLIKQAEDRTKMIEYDLDNLTKIVPDLLDLAVIELAKEDFVRSIVFGMSIARAKEKTGLAYKDLFSTLEDQVKVTFHEDGKIESLSIDYKGIKRTQYFHISILFVDKENDREVEVFTPKKYGKDSQYTGIEVTTHKTGQWVSEIGCWFDKNRLIDYDGVYELMPYVIKALRKAGWTVPRDF